jgi:hypothetical protein
MGSDRLALYTTIYPGCEPFLASFGASIQEQTDRDFDLWIGLDHMTAAVVLNAVGRLPRVHWVIANLRETPASLRQRAFAMLVESYDEVVLVDADDLLQRGRISAAREALESCDVAACALRLVDAEGRDLGLASFGPEPDADWHELLPRYNVFGLSNTAWRADTLARCLPVPSACTLIDWLLATRAMVTGAALRFDPAPRMAYRQHAHNCASVLPPFTADGVLIASERVVQHYRLLLDGNWPWPAGTRLPFEQARARAERFDRVMHASPDTLASYVIALNQRTPRFVWWWAVAHPDLEELWTPAA